jgi:hypothetical protein
MVDQTGFRVELDANPHEFPVYEDTHGLPKSIQVVGAEKGRGTNLLTSDARPLNLNDPKYPQLRVSEALLRDAYLLWRLSERYAQDTFRIGYLDKDRICRLRQLGAVELVDESVAAEAANNTLIRICCGRQSLNAHYEQLRANAETRLGGD